MVIGAKHFLLLGGELCLDFTNTVNRHSVEQPIARLASYTDLAQWSQQAGILTEAEADRLVREGRKREQEAAAVLEKAWLLQNAIYRIFSAFIEGESPRAQDMQALNDALSQALARQRIVAAAEHFEWTWASAGDSLDRMLGPILRSAADLLTSERLARVKKCGGCNWLFLDASKNGSRRWCMMSVCGNRAKARRHYDQVRSARGKQQRKGRAQR